MAVAVEYGVGWRTIMRAVRDHGRPLVDDPARLVGVAAVGVDETAFLAATSRHHTEFATGIVDLTGHQAELLDCLTWCPAGPGMPCPLGDRDVGLAALAHGPQPIVQRGTKVVVASRVARIEV